ncbi:potassium channel protein [Haladaptatus sp. AB618]|uniref:potassium channel family protein n=1 Tax=Haladaptatus sp. AB618 TaxID=2934173 RepID=UPI00209C6C2B|nr:TrkA C-terminal domain-containing protein [Haladaptatus sp. AB618]MCO8256004.1 potassium channel protein [Haladaptatus sp. AB618]
MAGFDPADSSEPRNVKSLVQEMKDRSGLLLDLAYSAVLLVDQDVTPIVFDLVDRIDTLELQARMSLLLAARSPSDAEQLAPVLGIIDAVDDVSDAVAEIVTILDDRETPSDLRSVVPATAPIVVWQTVGSDTLIGEKSLGSVRSEIGPDISIVAIQRDDAWIFDTRADMELLSDDVLFLRGTRETLQRTGQVLESGPSSSAQIDDVDVAARIIVRMKRLAELAVGLAYGCILYDSPNLAAEVQRLDRELRDCQTLLEDWTLRAARRGTEPTDVRWFISIGACSRLIGDAALEMSEGVRLGLETPPVVGEAIAGSDEHIHRVTVDPRSEAVGDTLDDLDLTDDGVETVLAIRRTGGEWVLTPTGTTVLKPNDILLIMGTRESERRPLSGKL